MLATKSHELKKAVGVLKELSADERTRMIAEDREKARRDEASRLNGAIREMKRIAFYADFHPPHAAATTC